MKDQLIIEDLLLAQQIQKIASQENRSIQEVIASMVKQYSSQRITDRDIPDVLEMVRQVRLDAYERAREYWRRNGDEARANLSDQELDESFWLFDAENVPHLKTDNNNIELPIASLHRAGRVLRSAEFRSGQTDISMQSREILENEFTDYLVSRTHMPDDEGYHDDSA